MNDLRLIWSRSTRVYRILLISALIWAVLRLAVHAIFLAELLKTGGIEGYDLQVYLDAAQRLQLRQDLYPPTAPDWIEFYQYSPAYAWVFMPFLQLPLAVNVTIFSILHILAYFLLYWQWKRIFRRLGLKQASEMLGWALPLWLVFSQFWADLGYLNVYVFMALFSTLLVGAILEERLGWSVLWITVILQVKPQWAFPLIIPLLLGRYRFFFKFLGLTIAAYLVVAGATMLALGPVYGWQQHFDYAKLLWGITRGTYPWRGPDKPFLGYNHSIRQIIVYIAGIAPGVMRLATGIKIALLVPLLMLCLRHLHRPVGRIGCAVPQLSLDLAFALYLAAFIWLDVVWEVTLSIAVFTYLLATLDRGWARIWAWVVFLPYALEDFWQVISFAVFGMDIILPGPYILTDPGIYVPLVMMVIVSFYALLVRQLWMAAPKRQMGIVLIER